MKLLSLLVVLALGLTGPLLMIAYPNAAFAEDDGDDGGDGQSDDEGADDDSGNYDEVEPSSDVPPTDCTANQNCQPATPPTRIFDNRTFTGRVG